MRLRSLLLICALGSCKGEIGNPVSLGGGGGGPLGDDGLAATSGARRLTRVEYDNTIESLLGDDTRPGFAALPEDKYDPFDNNFQKQQASQPLIESVETLAEQIAVRFLADTARRDALVGCTPSGPDDADCLRGFVTRFGRLALRRPLTDEEVDRYMTLQSFAVERADFWVGVELVLRAILQDPEFLYRIELGEAVAGQDGLFALNGYEIATRLSYFLWAAPPDAALLDIAEEGGLDSSAERRDVAATMLEDPRAVEQVLRFHALWLGYDHLPHSAELNEAMMAESEALVRRVVFEDDGDYFDLFRADETWVGDLLANQYGLTPPGQSEPTWVPYGDSGRQGILSHGSVLSAFAKFSDTSPTQRGKFIRTRLLCDVIQPPPPNVNVDEPPQSPDSDCKWDRYAAHRSSGACATCHGQMDPIGFGLENFDREGRYRTHDEGLPECPIAGDGEIVGTGTFNGPAELSDLLISSGELGPCAVQNVWRFAVGRDLGEADDAAIGDLWRAFDAGGRHFQSLLLEVVASEAFGYRMEEP